MQKADLNRNKEKLMSDVNERGEERHRVIDNIIKILKSDIDKTESKHLAVLQRHEDEINQSTLEITQRIGELNKLLDCNDDILSRYKSRNAELRKLPPILNFLTKLLFQRTDTEHLIQQFGSLSELSITKEERLYTKTSLETSYLHSNITLSDESIDSEDEFLDAPVLV